MKISCKPSSRLESHHCNLCGAEVWKLSKGLSCALHWKVGISLWWWWWVGRWEEQKTVTSHNTRIMVGFSGNFFGGISIQEELGYIARYREFWASLSPEIRISIEDGLCLKKLPCGWKRAIMDLLLRSSKSSCNFWCVILDIFHWNHPEESWSTDWDWRYVLFPYPPFIKNCHWCHVATGCHVAKIQPSSFLPDSDEFITRTVGRFDPLILLQQFLFGEANSHLGALLTESYIVVDGGTGILHDQPLTKALRASNVLTAKKCWVAGVKNFWFGSWSQPRVSFGWPTTGMSPPGGSIFCHTLLQQAETIHTCRAQVCQIADP